MRIFFLISFPLDCAQQCCLTFIGDNLGTRWKELGRKLNVKHVDIENIAADCKGQKEQGFQVLMAWKQSQGTKAFVSDLINALELLGLKDVADKLNKHCSCHNDNLR